MPHNNIQPNRCKPGGRSVGRSTVRASTTWMTKTVHRLGNRSIVVCPGHTSDPAKPRCCRWIDFISQNIKFMQYTCIAQEWIPIYIVCKYIYFNKQVCVCVYVTRVRCHCLTLRDVSIYMDCVLRVTAVEHNNLK